MGPLQIGTAAKKRWCVPAGGAEPLPYGVPDGAAERADVVIGPYGAVK